MNRNLILLSSILLFITSCNQITKSKTIRDGEPDVYNIEGSDSKMNMAIENAKKSIQQFQDALKSNNPEYEYFSIKQRFDTPEGGEHIWIQDIKLVDSQFIGILGNEPVNIKEVNFGDTITVDNKKISDWMYFDKGKVKGGFTIKALRDEMSKEEQQIFDSESGLIFE
ncbi:MAG: DUF2314 domain-containing protein [Flavobacteriaceae bacterium]|nr:DUF2314 domain-containing protein [Flavobacteriaceae bacterium]